jgi:hypothetical protein
MGWPLSLGLLYQHIGILILKHACESSAAQLSPEDYLAPAPVLLLGQEEAD